MGIEKAACYRPERKMLNMYRFPYKVNGGDEVSNILGTKSWCPYRKPKPKSICEWLGANLCGSRRSRADLLRDGAWITIAKSKRKRRKSPEFPSYAHEGNQHCTCGQYHKKMCSLIDRDCCPF